MHRALQISVQNCRHGALIFAELAHNLPRKHHRHVADVKFLILAADDFLHLLLVNGIQKSPKQRNHESPRSFADQIAHFFTHIVLVQRTKHAPRGIDALLDSHDHFARNDGIGFLLHTQIAALLHASAVDPLRATADQSRIFVAFCRYQPKPRSLPLQQSVQGNRGRVPDHVDFGQQGLHAHAERLSPFLDHVGKTNR